MKSPILLLGFEPFGSHQINPSQRLIEYFSSQSFDEALICHTLPVAQKAILEQVGQLLHEVQPKAVVALGLAGGTTIRMERVAINLADFRIPDAGGDQPIDQIIQENGPSAYFSTLPMREMMVKLNQQGIPSTLSDTAGTYICNLLLYQLLHRAKLSKQPFIAGFFHLPMLPEMVAQALLSNHHTGGPPPPSMALSTMRRGLQIALEHIRMYLDNFDDHHAGEHTSQYGKNQ